MLNKPLALATDTQSLARAVFSTGVVLLVGAAITFAYAGSREAPRTVPEVSSPRPLVFMLPQAYDNWHRTDFVGREGALAALDRVSGDAGLEPLAAQDGLAGELALGVYRGEGGSFAILLARGNGHADWTLPSRPVRVINGRLFENNVVVESGVVDLTLRTRSGLTVLIRGRAGPEVIESFVMRMTDF